MGLLQTKLLMSFAYHLQIDGQMERTHSTLEKTLHFLLSEGGLYRAQWCTLLPKVEFALNCYVCSSIKLSSAELAFGHKLVKPSDIVIGIGF